MKKVKVVNVARCCRLAALLLIGFAISASRGFALQAVQPDLKDLLRQALEKSRKDATQTHLNLKPLVDRYGRDAILAICDAFEAEPEGDLKYRLGWALTNFPDEAVDERIISLVRDDPGKASRCNSVEYLEIRFPKLDQAKQTELLDALVNYMRANHDIGQAALFIGEHGRQSDIQALRAAQARFEEPADWRRVNWMGETRSSWGTLTMALGRLRDQEALDHIVLSTASRIPGERAWAAKALAYVGSPAYLPLLREMVSDDTPVEAYVSDFIGANSGGHSDNALDLVAARSLLQIAEPKPRWTFLREAPLGQLDVPTLGKHSLDSAKGGCHYSCNTLSPDQRTEILLWLDKVCSLGTSSGEAVTAMRAELLRSGALARMRERETSSAKMAQERSREESIELRAQLLLCDTRRSTVAESLAREDFAKAERAFLAFGDDAALKFYLLRIAYGTIEKDGAASFARYPSEMIAKVAQSTFWPVLLDRCQDSWGEPSWDLCASVECNTAYEVFCIHGQQSRSQPYFIATWLRRVYLFESEFGDGCHKSCFFEQGERRYLFNWNPERTHVGVEMDGGPFCTRGSASTTPQGVRVSVLAMTQANLLHWDLNMVGPPEWSKPYIPAGEFKCLTEYAPYRPFSPNANGESSPRLVDARKE